MEEFKSTIESLKPDIVAITETWFKSLSVPNLLNYIMYRRDRSDGRRGGGVIIYISNRIKSFEINDLKFNNNKLEQVWCMIEVNLERILIGCIYRPTDTAGNEVLNEVIYNAKEYVNNKKCTDLMIVGDFNFNCIQWNNGSSELVLSGEDSIEEKFCDVINDCFLYQHVHEPTFKRENEFTNVLDLIFTDDKNRIATLKTGPLLGNTSQGHVILTWNYIISETIDLDDDILDERFLFNKGNYKGMSNYLRSINWLELLNNESVDRMYCIFEAIIKEACDLFIPKANFGLKKNKIEWINKDIKALIRRKWNLWYYNRSIEWKSTDKINEYKNLCKKVKHEVKNAKRKFEENLANKAKKNPKLLFKYIKKSQKVREYIRALMNSSNQVTNDPRDIVEILNDQFQSVFVKERDSDVLPDFPMRTINECSEIDISYNDILSRLKNLNPDKSCGVDEIRPKVLQECASELAVPLTLIYSDSIKKGEIPLIWKLANISPLYKKGSRLLAENYRPVSLTSVPCKILEGVIKDKIMKHLNEDNLITKVQHGFVKRKSCVTNLLETLDDITSAIDNKFSVDVIYLDFAKAFDTVPHQRLTHKLKSYGIEGKILNWIKEFLNNRKQRVIQGDTVSCWKDVFSGVPQGSVLGPILFLIYINDLPDNILNTIKLFADDTKLISVLDEDYKCSMLQEDLNKISEWCKKWLILLNAQKCKVIHFGSKNKKTNYFLFNHKTNESDILEKSDVEKDLGIFFSSNLKWKNQVTSAAAKANQILGMLKRTFTRLNPMTFKVLYTSYVRPHLEYAISVWSPYFKYDIQLLEKVQERATKIVPGFQKIEYSERLKRLDLLSLEKRRRRGDLIQMYKLAKKIETLQVKNLPGLNQKDVNFRSNHLRLEREINVNSSRFNFLYNRVANDWNQLTDEIVDAKNLNAFKNMIDNKFFNY